MLFNLYTQLFLLVSYNGIYGLFRENDAEPTSPSLNISSYVFFCVFEILSELGLVGFIIFVSFFFYLIFRFINNFILSKSFVLLSVGTFIILQLIPFLPTGSFFTSFGSTIFFINIALMYTYLKKKDKR